MQKGISNEIRREFGRQPSKRGLGSDVVMPSSRERLERATAAAAAAAAAARAPGSSVEHFKKLSSATSELCTALSPALKMSQVCMLDSDRLSSLLKDALSWSDHVSSLLVSATNGSILAYAYRDETPKIKDIRTQSTTMMTAYAMASEDTLVFEAQNSGAIIVITPVADRVLLGVTGPESKKSEPLQNGHSQDDEHPAINGTSEHEEEGEEHETGQDANAQQIRDDLEVVSQDLANVLREELSTMRWPDDI